MKDFGMLRLAVILAVGLGASQVFAQDDWETEDRGREGGVQDAHSGGTVDNPWGTSNGSGGSGAAGGGSGAASGGGASRTRSRSTTTTGSRTATRSSSGSRTTRSSAGSSTTANPTTGISDPTRLTIDVYGKSLSDAYYHGWIVTGRAGGGGQPGQWIYFRRVLSWRGTSTNSAGQIDAAVITFGPEEWVYYP